MYRMRSRLLPLLVATAVGLAVVPSVAAGAATKRVAGCGKTATPGLTTQHLAVDGSDREYLLSIPESYDASKRAPLLFNFHGLGSTMQEQALYSGLNQKAGAEGYIVITPNGTGTVLRRWSFPPLPGSAADVDFVKAMLATTQRSLCIDTKRIFSTGISNGAIFSTVLACALPGRLAAIAPVAGVNATDACSTGTPPTAVLAFHGTADPIVPYNGGAYFSGVNARRTGSDPGPPGRRCGGQLGPVRRLRHARDHDRRRGRRRARRLPRLPAERHGRALPRRRWRPHVARCVPDCLPSARRPRRSTPAR